MRNITIAILESMYVNTANMWQWDYGQILRIQGKNIPKAVEVHFSLNEKGGDSITRIGATIDGVTDVPIPDSFLENNGRAQDYIIYAFVYLEDGESGNTEYKIRIPVKSRPKPEIPGTTEEPELFRETVKAVNAAADRAEVSEKNAKTSEEEAGKYAASASSSAEEAKKTKEDAIKEVAEKKQEAISAIEEQEKSSANSITNHTDEEIQRIQNQVTESETELEQTIKDASIGKTALDGSINAAGESKDDLDKSIKSATTAKTALDTSTEGAKKTKTALDGSIKTAGEKQTTLDTTVKTADKLDASLKEQITTGTQLQKDLVASGEKAVQDIQAAGSEQLDKMQAVAEAFTADREQIATNKEDISSLKDEMNKNFLDDAKTKRSLDALWKLNQGISYQFEMDTERAYQKDIPSGAKLASMKKIGGRTIAWNQLFNYQNIKTNTHLGVTYTNNDDGTYTANGTSTGVSYISKDIKFIEGHKYYMRSLTTLSSVETYKAYITGNNIFDSMTDVGYGAIDTASNTAIGYFVPLWVKKGITVENLKIIPQVYDLTKMFGAGNEPSTPEEFEAMFPADYYPYNAGELMCAPVNEVVYLDTKNQETSYPIPQAILDLDGYGDGASDDVYNYVDWENKEYHKRVGKVDLGSLVWTAGAKYGDYFRYNAPKFLIPSLDSAGNTLCAKFNRALIGTEVEGYNFHRSELYLIIQTAEYSTNTEFAQAMQGSMLYYELAKEEIIDISDIIDATFQEPIEVEAGGTLTFCNSNGDGYRLPIPNEEEYIVSLAEVGGGASE